MLSQPPNLSVGDIPSAIQLALQHHQAGRLKEAEAIYQSILQIKPKHPDALHFSGLIAYQKGDAEAAVGLMKKAIAVKRNVPHFHNNLGNIFKELGRRKEAVDQYKKALALQPDLADAHYNLGITLKELGRLDEAIKHYRRVTAINPNHAEAHNNLGNVYRVQGQLDKARECYQRALAINPASAQAHHNLVHFCNCFYDANKISVLEGLLQGPLSSDDATLLHFTLGKIHDAGKRYDLAFDHYRQGNELKRRTCSFDPVTHERYIDRLIAAYPADLFQHQENSKKDSDIPVFVVGMPRSGTSLVEHIIASHPRVFGGGELGFFPRLEEGLSQRLQTMDPYPECLGQLDERHRSKITREYLQKLRGLSNKALRISDKMPDNFLRLGLIRLLFPKARIIHCQRDAMDTCLSIYFQNFFGNNPYAYDLVELGRYYRQYERLMAHWQQVLPGAMLTVNYEALIADQAGVSKQLIDFLGLDWDERCLAFHEAVRDVSTASSAQVRQPIYNSSIERWRNYDHYLGPLKAAMQ